MSNCQTELIRFISNVIASSDEQVVKSITLEMKLGKQIHNLFIKNKFFSQIVQEQGGFLAFLREKFVVSFRIKDLELPSSAREHYVSLVVLDPNIFLATNNMDFYQPTTTTTTTTTTTAAVPVPATEGKVVAWGGEKDWSTQSGGEQQENWEQMDVEEHAQTNAVAAVPAAKPQKIPPLVRKLRNTLFANDDLSRRELCFLLAQLLVRDEGNYSVFLSA